MNFNLVEMYNGLLRFNKHILNELAEGLKHLPNYNEIRGSNEQDTDKAIRVLLLGGCASDGSRAGSGYFTSALVRPASNALIGFFTIVKLD